MAESGELKLGELKPGLSEREIRLEIRLVAIAPLVAIDPSLAATLALDPEAGRVWRWEKLKAAES